MGSKVQHLPAYRPIPGLLRAMREEAGLTQRALGSKLSKPQSWIQYCETAQRRVDLAEFIQWSRSCGADPLLATARYLRETRQATPFDLEVAEMGKQYTVKNKSKKR